MSRPAYVRHMGGVMKQWVDVEPRRPHSPLSPNSAHHVGFLRRAAAESVHGCGLSALADEVLLIISELVTNALVHSGTRRIGVEMAVQDGYLHVEVTDGVPVAATLRRAGDEDECGRGLALVALVAAEHHGSWGTRDGGRTTWCRLALPEDCR